MVIGVMSMNSPRSYPKVEIITEDSEKREFEPEEARESQIQINQQSQQQTNGSRKSSRMSRRASKYDKALVGRYRLIHTIGTGNFAKVKLASHLITGREVAIKIIDKTELSSSSRRKLSREVRLMKTLNHPNIVRLLEIIDTEKMMYLVMEYVSGGELYEYLADNGRMTEKLAREKFRQILSAVQYCHQKHIIHRDLKTENLLLDANFNIKLVDFGFANEFQEGTKLNTFCGSPPYAAPELFRGKEYDGPEVDVWSLGVILFKLVSGALPFDGRSLSELRERVLRGRYRIPFYMSTECERLLKKMLVLNPAKRHSIESIMKDRWVNMGYEDDPLSPYVEPKPDFTDPARIDTMMNMGYSLDAIIKSLKYGNFDEITATYYLLDKQQTPSNSKVTKGRAESFDKTESTVRSSNSNHSKENDSNADAVITQRETVEETHQSKLVPVTITRDDSTCVPECDRSNAVSNEEKNVVSSAVDQHEVNGSIPTDSKPREKVIMIYGNVDQKLQQSRASKETTGNRQLDVDRRPKTTYEFRVPDENENSAAKDRYRTPPIHWYPTAGVAMRNGVISPGDSISVTRAQNVDEEGPLRQPSEAISSDAGKHLDNQTASPEDQTQPAYNWSISKPASIQTNSSTTTPIQTGQKLPPVETVPFSRLNPLRQTVHSTNRPQLERQLEASSADPGIGGDKTAKVAIARTNLAELGSYVDDKHITNSPELSKPKGFFRTLTSRFSKRSRPLIEKSDTVAVREHEHANSLFKPMNFPSGQQTGTPNRLRGSASRSNSRPSSQISSGSSRFSRDFDNTRTVTPPPVNSDSPFGSQHNQDANDNSPFGFLRTLTVRLSKRKPNDYSSAPDGSIVNTLSTNKASSMKNQNSMVFLPPTIISSVQKETESPNPQTSLHRMEDSRTTITRSFSSRNSQTNGKSIGAVNDSSDVQKKPRVLRFTWSMKITSKLPPEEIVREIKRVLHKYKYYHDHRHKFLFLCETDEHTPDVHVQWEMEVCELSRLGLYGVRFHKLNGTAVAFKNVMTKVTQELRL